MYSPLISCIIWLYVYICCFGRKTQHKLARILFTSFFFFKKKKKYRNIFHLLVRTEDSNLSTDATFSTYICLKCNVQPKHPVLNRVGKSQNPYQMSTVFLGSFPLTFCPGDNSSTRQEW